MKDCLLIAEELSCTVAARCLFEHLGLMVRRGDLLEVRGPNGSGKSTLLRGLAGLHHWQTGRVERRGSIQYLGHKPGLAAALTPLENIRYGARLKGRNLDDAELAVALQRLGLRAARYESCGALSAGQRRRAALAGILVGKADVWLLDEPLTELDEDGVEIVRQLLAEHRRRGGAAICATHGRLDAAADAIEAGAKVVTLGTGA